MLSGGIPYFWSLIQNHLSLFVTSAATTAATATAATAAAASAAAVGLLSERLSIRCPF